MSQQTPAGWYPDPAGPGSQRYWDGAQWTQHTAPGAVATAAYGGYVNPPPTTPDGVPLAGWWQRVGASLLDSLILLIPIGLLSYPFVHTIIHVYSDYFHQAMDAAQAGRQAPASTGLYGKVLLPSLGISAVSLVVQLAYHATFLRWKGATLGKLALGLRVRLREQPGQLAWPVIWRHIGGQFGYAVVALIPFAGSIAGLYPLLDSLWPLWDDKKQAIHDKVAGTNVVRTR